MIISSRSLAIFFTFAFVASVFTTVDRAAAQSSNDDPCDVDAPNAIVGTEGKDQLNGTNGADVIIGLGGDDVINGKDGDDIVCAGGGDDKVNGQKGDDVIYGGDGNDRINSHDGDDLVDGGPGDDNLAGGGGNDNIDGQDGVDIVDGGNGTDVCDDAERHTKCETVTDNGPPSTDPVNSDDLVLFESDDVRITYRQSGNASGKVQATVTIENLSNDTIQDWTLILSTDIAFQASGGAGAVGNEGDKLLVQPNGSGPIREIAGQDQVTVDLAADAESSSVLPPAYALLLEGGMSLTDDGDNDGVPDYIEVDSGLDTSNGDSDNDGLSDALEFMVRFDPSAQDSDSNGIADGDEDSDGDNLTNLEEDQIGTALLSPDTDRDQLDDGTEVDNGTDPLNPDTDGDGVSDGLEIQNGSDPKVADSAFNVTQVGPSGHATQPSVTIDGLSASQVSSFSIARLPANRPFVNQDTPGLIDQPYEFILDGEFDTAQVSFSYDPALNSPTFDPAIYKFDEETQVLRELPNQTVDGDTVAAEITSFSEYVLLDRFEFNKVWLFKFLEDTNGGDTFDKLDIAFVIDSSGSMTSTDPNDLRLDVTKDFVQRLSSNSRGGIVDFDSSYTILSGLTSDKQQLIDAVDGINSSGGTSISSAVTGALQLFAPESDPDTQRVVVLLTDGRGSYAESLTDQAALANITIYTVGLGQGVDQALLTSIAEGTGGKYYPASQAEELSEVFESISDASDLQQDSDNDGLSDYYEKEIQAGRLRIGTGRTIGQIDPFDPDSDNDGLLDGEELSIVSFELNETERRVYGFLKSDPLKVDTDDDGKDDSTDDFPLVYNPSDMEIHQSANREGRRKEPDRNNFQVPPSQLVADDLTFNDYTRGELADVYGEVLAASAKLTPEWLIWWELDKIFDVGRFGANEAHQQVVTDLRNQFRNGNGGQPSTPVTVADNYDPAKFDFYRGRLNETAGQSDEMQAYLNTATSTIVSSIKSNRGDLEHLTLEDDLSQNYLYKEFENSIRYPRFDFSVRDPNERALSIAIHAFHGFAIEIKDYKLDGNSFSGTLVFRSYDHFGLDPDDEIVYPGFVDWFTLQHYDRFEGKYVPPLAIVEQEVPITGAL